jgi:3-hydroxyacyl-[acyl-carrier-protein] dehydratase
MNHKAAAPVTLPVDVEQIQRLLPHRYPFLLVDRVVEFEPGKCVVGVKNVSINEPFFQGHFPGHPVMPGVLIVEALAQTAGLLTQLTALAFDEPPTSLFYLAKVDKARFNARVVPGDQLRMEVSLKRLLRNIGIFSARALVDGGEVASCELMCAAPGKGDK